MNLNAAEEPFASGDADVAVLGGAQVSAGGSDSADIIDASGKPPFEGPLSRRLLLIGDAGDDELRGGAAHGIFFGDDGNDVIVGSGRRDEIHDGDGDDVIQALGGDDLIDADLHNADFYAGGAGVDLLDYGHGLARHGTRVNLGHEAPQDVGLYGVDILSNIEDLFSGEGDDRLVGDAADNYLFSSGGEDTLLGRGGNDRLVGAEDSDRLTGGAGTDLLLGNRGVDSLFARDGSRDSLINCGGPKARERARIDRIDPSPVKC